MIYQTEGLTFDTKLYRLLHGDQIVSIEPQVFDLLVYLIENRDRVVPRDELLANLWKGRVVSDTALSARLKAARKAIGDSGDTQTMIKTVHGRGYQFVAPITDSPQASDDPDSADPQRSTSPQNASIAVLPFQNLSGDPEQDYLSKGFTDVVVTALSRISDLFVISREATNIYREQPVNVEKVGREQGVCYVLEGGVHKSGNRVRITARLTDTQTGRQTWADRYDRELDDIFAIQDDITQNIIVSLQVQLIHGPDAVTWASGTNNVEAWTNVVRGWEAIDRYSRSSILDARRFGQKAIELDPEYAGGWTMLSWTYCEDADWEWTDTRSILLGKALHAAQKAQKLAPDNPTPYSALCYIQMSLGNYDDAIELGKKGVELAPGHGEALAILAFAQVYSDQPEQALQSINNAMHRMPIYPPWYLMIAGMSYFLLGQKDRSVKVLKQAVEREPESPLCRPWLIIALVAQGLMEDAQRVARELLDMDPSFTCKRWLQSPLKDTALLEQLRSHLHTAGVPN